MRTTATICRTVSVEEAAELLGIHRASLYRLIAAEKVETIRLGRRIRISSAYLDDLIAGRVQLAS